jgi:hypothetical protein
MTANITFGLFLLASAAGLAVIAWRMLKADKANVRLSAASAAWPTVPGLVGAVRVDEQSQRSYDSETNSDTVTTTYEPKVDYTYAVAGRDYAGTRINFARLQFSSEKKARAVIANYATGATVTVAYDPADPQNSVLDRTTKPPAVSFWTGFIFVMAAVVAALGVVMLFIKV